MADGEHLGPQTRHLWLVDKKGPLEGTEKHPQGRLFSPTGSYSGDPMRLHPSNWMNIKGQTDTPAHDDIISWHSSEESSLPRSDEYEHRQHDPGDFEGDDWGNPYYDDEGEENQDFTDFSVDSKERPMGAYGSVVGMHFGDLQAAMARSPRPYAHPARIPSETIADPPRGNFSTERPGGSIAGGPMRSNNDVVNRETGERVKDTRWSDVGANFAEKATDLVESGKTLAYRNDVEAVGSTSYRALPETVRTWSEDVMSAKRPDNSGVASKYGWHDDPHAFRNTPHPALVHLAEAGYDPVVLPKERPEGATYDKSGLQLNLFHDDIDYQHPAVAEHRQRQAEFDRGHNWRMQKPT